MRTWNKLFTAKNHSQRTMVVRPQDDVVHVSLEPGQNHERDMHREEADPGKHHQEVDRARSLPPPEDASKPLKMVDHGG